MAAPPRILMAIQTAHDLVAALQDLVPGIPELRPRLDLYRAAIAANQALHQDLGLAAACAQCATTALGSCCFSGVEHNYDSWLLLLNLLLGVELPHTPIVQGKCFFLGPQGCRLLARHYYCQRFLCPEVAAKLDPGGAARLQEALNQEQACQLALEELLRPRLRRAAVSSK